MPVICPYCDRVAELVKGDRIYPYRRDLHEKHFYLCSVCDAYVGCHPGTSEPLGRLANELLRALKIHAHCAFDKLWRTSTMTRTQAYRWLAEQLDIPDSKCHIGMFDGEQCRRAIKACEERE